MANAVPLAVAPVVTLDELQPKAKVTGNEHLSWCLASWSLARPRRGWQMESSARRRLWLSTMWLPRPYLRLNRRTIHPSFATAIRASFAKGASASFAVIHQQRRAAIPPPVVPVLPSHFHHSLRDRPLQTTIRPSTFAAAATIAVTCAISILRARSFACPAPRFGPQFTPRTSPFASSSALSL
ncbi:hypothetical protein B0H13DRAFT_1983136, partial [Mycena leptocephala]